MLRSINRRALIAILALLCAGSVAQAQTQFSVYPENELVITGALGQLVNQPLTIVNNTSTELKLTATSGGDEHLGIDLPKEIVMQPFEKFNISISYQADIEAKGYVILTDGTITKRILISGLIDNANTPTESIKREEYVTFGPIPSGKTQCMPIEVTNISKSTLEIDYTLSGYSKGVFNIPTDNIPHMTLKPGETGSVNVCFAAKDYDSKEELVFSYGVNGMKEQRSTWLLGILEREVDPNVECLVTNGKVGIGPVMLGQSAEGSIYLLNQTDKAITITGATIAGTRPDRFTMKTPFPYTIDARAKTELRVVFTPQEEGQNSAEMELALQSEVSNCTSAIVQLTGWTTDKVKDNSRYPIFASEKKAIGIEWGPNVIMQKVIFNNNLDHEVEIKQVKLRDGIDFRIVQSTPTVPCMLKPDESLILVLATGMDGKPYFTDQVIFVTSEDAAGEQKYDLQGVAQSSVDDAANREIELSVGPNPAVNELNISLGNASIANISIHDIAGKEVANFDGVQSTWHTSGHASGVYFVTATGKTVSDKSFTVTRSVIVQ